MNKSNNKTLKGNRMKHSFPYAYTEAMREHILHSGGRPFHPDFLALNNEDIPDGMFHIYDLPERPTNSIRKGSKFFIVFYKNTFDSMSKTLIDSLCADFLEAYGKPIFDLQKVADFRGNLWDDYRAVLHSTEETMAIHPINSKLMVA